MMIISESQLSILMNLKFKKLKIKPTLSLRIKFQNLKVRSNKNVFPNKNPKL